MRTLPDPLDQIPPQALPCTIADGFTFAAVGDLIGPVRPETPLKQPGFEAVIRILQQAEVAFANLEGSIFDVDTFAGCRAAENGGGYPVSDVAVARDLKAMGIDLVSRANNHATDWGAEGLLATSRALNQAGVAHAGGGPSKPAARAPALLETPMGRVALLSTASTYTPMSEAGNADGELAPRPGISVLGLTTVTLLTPPEMAMIHRVAVRQGIGKVLDSRSYGNERQLSLGAETFRGADQAGLTYDMNPIDHAELLRSVRGAKQIADFVAFAIHAHESESGDGTDRRPGDFLPVLFRHAIDAGADMALTTGPHLVRGVEIYKGKPIFYGLGSFFLEVEGGRGPTADAARSANVDPLRYTKPEFTQARLGQFPDDWFDSVVAVSSYRNGTVAEIHLYPLRLERKTDARMQGAPRRAYGADARRILERLQQDSRQFGTAIDIEGDIGIVRAGHC